MSKIRGFSRNRQQSFPSNIRNGHAFQIAMDRFHSLTHKSLSSVRCFYAKFDSVSIWITESCYCELVFGFRSIFEMYQEPRSQLLNFAFPVCFSLFFCALHFFFIFEWTPKFNVFLFLSRKKLAKSVQILSINCLPLNHRPFGIFFFYTFHLSLTCPQSYQVSLLCVLLFFFFAVYFVACVANLLVPKKCGWCFQTGCLNDVHQMEFHIFHTAFNVVISLKCIISNRFGYGPPNESSILN